MNTCTRILLATATTLGLGAIATLAGEGQEKPEGPMTVTPRDSGIAVHGLAADIGTLRQFVIHGNGDLTKVCSRFTVDVMAGASVADQGPMLLSSLYNFLKQSDKDCPTYVAADVHG